MSTLTTIMDVKDNFEGLNPEHEKELRRLDIKKDSILEWLIRGYSAVRKHPIEEAYPLSQAVLDMLPKRFTGGDVERLSTYLSSTNNDPAPLHLGAYLTVCAHLCSDDQVRIITRTYPDHIGVQNRDKNLTVIGNVGGYLARYMSGGLIDVHGDCIDTKGRDFVGENMSGGKVHIHGNFKGWVERMSGGEIEIDGDLANSWIGAVGKDGTIIIKGDCSGGYLDSKMNGKIYLNKGKPRGWDYVQVNGEVYYNGKLLTKDEGGLVQWPH